MKPGTERGTEQGIDHNYIVCAQLSGRGYNKCAGAIDL